MDSKIFVKSLLIMAVADGELSDSETNIIRDILNEAWNDDYGDLKVIVNNAYADIVSYVNGGGDISVMAAENARKLSELNAKDKKSILSMLESIRKADNLTSHQETKVYIKFKEALDLDAGFFGFFKKALVSIFNEKCVGCKSTRVVLRDIQELDRWIGKKQVTEKMASGSTKTRYIQVTYVKNSYRYSCDECGHEFSIVKKEEK